MIKSLLHSRSSYERKRDGGEREKETEREGEKGREKEKEREGGERETRRQTDRPMLWKVSS